MPTLTATPDPDAPSVRYGERPAWRALLGWPQECEDAYGRFPHQPQDDPSNRMTDAYPPPSILFDGAGTPWAFLGWAFRVENERLQPPVAGLRVLISTVDATGQLWVVGQAAGDAPAIWVLESDDG